MASSVARRSASVSRRNARDGHSGHRNDLSNREIEIQARILRDKPIWRAISDRRMVESCPPNKTRLLSTPQSRHAAQQRGFPEPFGPTSASTLPG